MERQDVTSRADEHKQVKHYALVAACLIYVLLFKVLRVCTELLACIKLVLFLSCLKFPNATKHADASKTAKITQLQKLCAAGHTLPANQGLCASSIARNIDAV